MSAVLSGLCYQAQESFQYLVENVFHWSEQTRVCYLSVNCSRAPSLVQLILGGGLPSTGQRMVSDRVALVRRALCPMVTLMFFWKASGRFCCCLMIRGVFTGTPSEECSDQLGRLSKGKRHIQTQDFKYWIQDQIIGLSLPRRGIVFYYKLSIYL